MKRISILVAALALVVSSPVLAGQNNTGCGIGTMIFEGNDGLISQVFAATTNGIFGNQTFGITSGTLDCDQPASFVSAEQLESFVGDNMDQLAMDISRGEGEYLLTLAVLLEVPAEERPEFCALLQSNFSTIYPDAQVTHTDVLNNLELVLRG